MDKKWWTLIAVCIGTFMLLLDVTIVVVALPEIEVALHASFSDVQWVVDAYALTLASVLLTAGVLADRFGRRRLFAIGLVIFTCGSLLCGVAQDPLMLIVSRSGQGIGGAIMFSTSLALLAQSFHGRDRGIAFGAWGAITGAGVASGPILGGLITSGINWRGIFLVNVPVGIVALAVTLWRVEESKAEQPSRPDVPGFVLLTTGLVALVYGLIKAGETSFRSATVIGCLIGGVVLLIAFIATELHVANPMFDMSLFRTPTFVGGAIAAFCMNASLFTMLLYLVLYLQNVLSYSALATGVRLLLITGGTLFAAALAGRLSAFVPVRLLIGPGLAVVGIGLLLMTGLSGTTGWTKLIAGFLVAGIGAGFVNPPLGSTAIGVVTPERAGMASGVNATFRQIGFATSIAALGSIFTSAFNRGLRAHLAVAPALAAHASAIEMAVRRGTFRSGITAIPSEFRPLVVLAVRSGFASGIDDLCLVTAIIAFVGSAASFILIRSRDFVTGEGREAHLEARANAATEGVNN